jgi:hypothetical protein
VLALQERGDSAVDPARHRDQDPLPIWLCQPLVRRSRPSQRAMQGIGGKLRRVPLGRRQPPDRLVDLVNPDPSRIENRLPVNHLSHRRSRSSGGAAPLGVESDARDGGVLNHERNSRKISASGSSSGARERAILNRTETARITQIVLEQLLAHPLQGRRPPLSAQQPAQIGNHSGRVVAKLPPRNAGDSPPVDEQQAVALPILLESQLRAVRFPPIELNDQPLLSPEAIGLEESALNGNRRIPPRARQIGAIKDSMESPLQLSASDPPYRRAIPKQST